MLSREVGEAVQIANFKGDTILNNKEEYNPCILPSVNFEGRQMGASSRPTNREQHQPTRDTTREEQEMKQNVTKRVKRRVENNKYNTSKRMRREEPGGRSDQDKGRVGPLDQWVLRGVGGSAPDHQATDQAEDAGTVDQVEEGDGDQDQAADQAGHARADDGDHVNGPGVPTNQVPRGAGADGDCQGAGQDVTNDDDDHYPGAVSVKKDQVESDHVIRQEDQVSDQEAGGEVEGGPDQGQDNQVTGPAGYTTDQMTNQVSGEENGELTNQADQVADQEVFGEGEGGPDQGQDQVGGEEEGELSQGAQHEHDPGAECGQAVGPPPGERVLQCDNNQGRGGEKRRREEDKEEETEPVTENRKRPDRQPVSMTDHPAVWKR